MWSQILTGIGVVCAANCQLAAFLDSKGWERDFGEHAPAWRHITVYLATIIGGVLASKSLPPFEEVVGHVQNLHLFD